MAIAARKTQEPSSRWDGGMTSSVRIEGVAAARAASPGALGRPARIERCYAFFLTRRGSLQKCAEQSVIGDDPPGVEQRESERPHADAELQRIGESLQLPRRETER